TTSRTFELLIKSNLIVPCDENARVVTFYFRDTFRFFMTCISDGSLERGRHGRRGLSIYPGGSKLAVSKKIFSGAGVQSGCNARNERKHPHGDRSNSRVCRGA